MARCKLNELSLHPELVYLLYLHVAESKNTFLSFLKLHVFRELEEGKITIMKDCQISMSAFYKLPL